MSSRLFAVLFAFLAVGVAAACTSSALESTAEVGDAGGSGAAPAAGGADGECELGTERCDCRPDGSCDPNLTCLSNLCVDAQALCPYAGDGFCDEPYACPVGTDPDCCALPHDGVCEEIGMGGECADGTDAYDCGYCQPEWLGDGYCDEPESCPAGTDALDCCAHAQDGECEEVGMGGECAPGSDSFDCGYCRSEWIGDGYCDEPEFCPQGTDAADCCAWLGNGECEEIGMGGECPAGSDWFDCGACPSKWVGDGYCDETQQGGPCPSNSDAEDCCATWGDELCEEPSADGACPTQSDYFDCGYCPSFWRNDGFCQEARAGGPCPDGSDEGDCCATFRDGTCEEEAMGGECPELTDWYDCGYCPEVWLEDGYCDETSQSWACPADSDANDCAP